MNYRTKQEKQDEVKIIVNKLTELKLTTIYDPIQQLFKLLKEYIQNDKDINIKIPFREIRKTIIGCLPVNRNKQCWVKLTSE
tara:strand:+ start:11330 stop:11575 length:246 start_codon:yes stop_codon:yes gene_type:complete